MIISSDINLVVTLEKHVNDTVPLSQLPHQASVAPENHY